MFENCFYSSNPPEFNRKAWYGLIFRWYGMDKNGNIAIFETGELPIPKKVFFDENLYREADMFFRQLPQVTKATVVNKMTARRTVSGKPLDFSDWLTESSRGLFLIDEMDTFVEKDYWYGYYLITIPENKLNIKTLPEKIRNFLEMFYFPIDFSDIEKIDVTDFLECD